MSVLNYCRCAKVYSSCICENGKYFKSVVDDSRTVCDEMLRMVYQQMCKQVL